MRRKVRDEDERTGVNTPRTSPKNYRICPRCEFRIDKNKQPRLNNMDNTNYTIISISVHS